MVVLRGQIWRADLGTPRGSSPGYERPVVVIQADGFNRANLNTIIVVIITSNLRLASMPGNVTLDRGVAGLEKESVVNVTQLYTVDQSDLLEFYGTLPIHKIEQIDDGLRLVLSL